MQEFWIIFSGWHIMFFKRGLIFDKQKIWHMLLPAESWHTALRGTKSLSLSLSATKR